MTAFSSNGLDDAFRDNLRGRVSNVAFGPGIEKERGIVKGDRMADDVPANAHRRFLQETAESLRRIADRLPSDLAREVRRVAKEIEENATDLKDAG
jgi:hypothetical protein